METAATKSTKSMEDFAKGHAAAKQEYATQILWLQLAAVAITFLADPPDSPFQRGYLEYIRERMHATTGPRR